ncbi:hypothetical protein G7054_g5292 [Neopestalotiopsis clavispora]|nr:hypothetical protein G7054_g5292 [Neopestalotiopsis clavispora]
MATTKSYPHLPTHLASPTHPILLRTLEPEDNAAFAAILSDPRNTDMEQAEHRKAEPMELATATAAIARMRDSAAQPTVVEDGGSSTGKRGQVLSGPGRVNLAIVYLGGPEDTAEGQELRRRGGLMIGLGGYGGINEQEVDGSGSGSAPKRIKRRLGDVGAMINPEYRGRGFATEAVRLAMEWGFRAAADGGLQFDAITATTLARNAAMVKVLDRFGWQGRPQTASNGDEELEYEISWEQWEANNGRQVP